MTIASDAKLKWWPAPAKLNLFLHLTGRRDDGYHYLQTLFQLLDYGDQLAFDIDHDQAIIERVTPLSGVASDEDLVVRAAQLLQKSAAVNNGVQIYLRKQLPMGGGLGGGSSDAATTLLVLNRLWNCGFSIDELSTIGAELGADIPIFVRGYTSWAEGIGDVLKPVKLEKKWYLVLKPAIEVSTEALFSSPELTRDCHPITIADFLGGDTSNVFQPLVMKSYPEVKKALQWLQQFASARLTGTGACVFAEFNSREQADKVIEVLPIDMQGFVAEGLNQSPLHAMLKLL